MTSATLKTLVTHNVGLKILSLLAAFGLWYNLASEPELATIVSVPVDYKNFPRDLVISSNIVDAVAVEARGPASRLREMQETRVAAVIDFASVKEAGERTFTLTGDELRPPRGVTLVRATPEQLRFTFERQITGKVPVEVSFSGVLRRGMTMGKPVVSPPEMVISGPQSRVVAVRKAVTDPFDLSRIAADGPPDQEQVLSTYIADSELRFASVPRVTVKIHFGTIANNN
jgi:YbbR domain-containing protein